MTREVKVNFQWPDQQAKVIKSKNVEQELKVVIIQW